MCQLLETIKIENKRLFNIQFHNERLNNSRKELFGLTNFLDLNDIIVIPENIDDNVYKCRVLYSKDIIKIEFEIYFKKRIKTLKVVECHDLIYNHKYNNRNEFENLKNKYADFDEVLITQNNIITDTTFSNIVFFEGKNWITPYKPLLNGTKRRLLISENKIFEKDIVISEIYNFQKACLINAFYDLEERDFIEINGIYK